MRVKVILRFQFDRYGRSACGSELDFVELWTRDASANLLLVLEAHDTLDLLGRLVDRSLVNLDEKTGRYEMLETVRQYGMDGMAGTEEQASVRDRHLAYYVEFTRGSEMRLRGRDQLRWQAAYQAEYDNIRAAIEWGLARETEWPSALAICEEMATFWMAQGTFREGIAALERLQKIVPIEEAGATSRVLSTLALLHRFLTGDEDLRLSRQALEFARKSGDEQALGTALFNLAFSYVYHHRNEEAEAMLEELLPLLQRLDNQIWEAFAHINIGNSLLVRGRLDEAEVHYLRCLEIREALGDLRGLGAANGALGQLAEMRGDLESAAERYLFCASAFLTTGDLWSLVGSMAGVCVYLSLHGRHEEIPLVLGCADAAASRLGIRRDVVDQTLHDKWMRLSQETLGEQAFSKLYRQGGESTPQEMVVQLGVPLPTMEGIGEGH